MSRNYIDTLYQIMDTARNAGIAHRSVEDQAINGRFVTVEGKKMVNLGSCSYLGLERHPALIEACVETSRSLGVQFSSSRSYLAVNLYEELEAHLKEIFGKPVLVSATTTLGHLSAIPVLVGDDDAVIMDMQVHSSVQMACQLLKARGINLSIIRHNDMESLERKINELKPQHKNIWFMLDGIYSMYGDQAPLEELQEMLARHKQLHLYCDDAHGFSWTGKHGMGAVRSQMAHHDRMYLTYSLSKSFGAAGGAIVFPNEETRERVQFCGGTMIFSGPIQPPLLAAGIASAKLHLSPEIEQLQSRLADLVAYTNQELKRAGIPQFKETDTPIFFIPVGNVAANIDMVNRLHSEGLFVNPAAFPATPMRRGGVRFLINNHLEKEDIDRLVAALVKHYPIMLANSQRTPEQLAKTFGIPEFALTSTQQIAPREEKLKVTAARSVRDLNTLEWDTLFQDKGNINSRSLAMLEDVFQNNESPFDNWDFHYVQVRDRSGHMVLSTFFTDLLTKDDMLSPAEVSQKVEDLRMEDPFLLTSRTVMLGCLITKAESLFLDRSHPEWKNAVRLLLREMEKVQSESGANQLMLGEFLGEPDPELKEFFLECGLSPMAMPNSNIVRNMNWSDEAGYLEGIPGRYRRDCRREILKMAPGFRVENKRPGTVEEVDHLYRLYESVFDKSFDVNVPKLPRKFFEEAFAHPDYDVLQLHFNDADPSENPIAFMLSHKDGGQYTALMVGLNYQYVQSHGTYKQILYRTVWRARELGCHRIDLAYTTDMVKKKVGATPVPGVAYVQAVDHFSAAQLMVM